MIPEEVKTGAITAIGPVSGRADRLQGPASQKISELWISSGGVTAEPETGQRELGLIRTGFGHAQQNAADADRNLSADLQEPRADGARGGLGEAGVTEAKATERFDQHMGK